MSESTSTANVSAGEHVENDSPEAFTNTPGYERYTGPVEHGFRPEPAAKPEVAKIQRYDVRTDVHDNAYGREDMSGEWVKYDDHIAAMVNPLNTSLCKDMPAFYKLLQFLLDNIGDLEQSPDFAGFKLQRATNDEGELQFIRLVPCDKIGDITSPRYVDEQPNKVIKAAVASTLKLVQP